MNRRVQRRLFVNASAPGTPPQASPKPRVRSRPMSAAPLAEEPARPRRARRRLPEWVAVLLTLLGGALGILLLVFALQSSSNARIIAELRAQLAQAQAQADQARADAAEARAAAHATRVRAETVADRAAGAAADAQEKARAARTDADVAQAAAKRASSDAEAARMTTLDAQARLDREQAARADAVAEVARLRAEVAALRAPAALLATAGLEKSSVEVHLHAGPVLRGTYLGLNNEDIRFHDGDSISSRQIPAHRIKFLSFGVDNYIYKNGAWVKR